MTTLRDVLLDIERSDPSALFDDGESRRTAMDHRLRQGTDDESIAFLLQLAYVARDGGGRVVAVHLEAHGWLEDRPYLLYKGRASWPPCGVRSGEAVMS